MKAYSNSHNRSLMIAPLADETALEIAELFKTFGDATRIQILNSLIGGELCVGEICEILKMSQSAVSHQLRVMRNNGVLKKRKSGRHIYYSVKDEHIQTLYQQGFAHSQEA